MDTWETPFWGWRKMTMDDQQLFGADERAAIELAAESPDRFPVDFDKAWRWIGYSRKDSALRALESNFEASDDFHRYVEVVERPQGGGSPTERMALTADCFKSFCMMAGTEQGKEVRAYFLRCERIAKGKPRPEDMTALQKAQLTLELAQRLVVVEAALSEAQPKLEQHKQLMDAGNSITVAEAAKELGTGQKRLFATMRDLRIVDRHNVAYQQYIGRGYFVVKARPIQIGEETHNHTQTFVTSKGLAWLADMLRLKVLA